MISRLFHYADRSFLSFFLSFFLIYIIHHHRYLGYILHSGALFVGGRGIGYGDKVDGLNNGGGAEVHSPTHSRDEWMDGCGGVIFDWG